MAEVYWGKSKYRDLLEFLVTEQQFDLLTEYLKRMTAKDIVLVLEFLSLVLERDLTNGLEVRE
jgi:hypothetical protein